MPKSRSKKKLTGDFYTILLLLMLIVGFSSALIGFILGRQAIKQVNPNPSDRRVLRPNHHNKPRKVNSTPPQVTFG
ncbi:MAG: hypothetical protein RMK91_00265 [Pseudanabaenaceae cyanobacterium SKYGB_i_bin29]|nr:hypothetical protein [Pseudanabaenaceae cyanobacterium SKYG29]MDW8420286.1 hypothetical protein [Pseudanabaenaceae cyanobacterium SKYGB_i_bin29]